MEERLFIEGSNARGHLEHATPIIDEWWWGQTRQCNRLEVRELRAEFILQEVFYERKGFSGPWVESQDYPRSSVCQPFSKRTQAIQRAQDGYKNARTELAELGQERLAEAWELHRRDLAYELQQPSSEVLDRIRQAEERESIEAMRRALLKPEAPDGRSGPIIEQEFYR